MKTILKSIGFRKKVKELLYKHEVHLNILEDDYKYIKFSSQSEKSDVWLEIKKCKFVIKELKSIL